MTDENDDIAERTARVNAPLISRRSWLHSVIFWRSR
jgi:hypothetical protein